MSNVTYKALFTIVLYCFKNQHLLYLITKLFEVLSIIMAATRGPKRARSAYNFFCKDNRAKTREEIAEANPELRGRELTIAVQKELGRDWSTFKKTFGCAIYHTYAELDKARYLREKMEGVTITVKPKRPRGRPPLNKVWNEDTGIYDDVEMPPPQPRRPRGRPPKGSYWCGKTGKYVKLSPSQAAKDVVAACLAQAETA